MSQITVAYAYNKIAVNFKDSDLTLDVNNGHNSIVLSQSGPTLELRTIVPACTTIEIQAYLSANNVSVSIDGGAWTTVSANNAWGWITLASGLSDAQHEVRIITSSHYFIVDTDAMFRLTGSNPTGTLSKPAGWGTIYDARDSQFSLLGRVNRSSRRFESNDADAGFAWNGQATSLHVYTYGPKTLTLCANNTQVARVVCDAPSGHPTQYYWVDLTSYLPSVTTDTEYLVVFTNLDDAQNQARGFWVSDALSIGGTVASQAPTWTVSTLNVGDSTALGMSGAAAGTERGHYYKLARRIRSNTYNLARGGAFTDELSGDWAGNFGDSRYSVTSILTSEDGPYAWGLLGPIGTNDANPSGSRHVDLAISGNYTDYKNYFRNLATSVFDVCEKVIHVKILPVSYDTTLWQQAQSEVLAEEPFATAFATGNAATVDLSSYFAPGGTLDGTKFEDGIHPTAPAETHMADVIEAAINSIADADAFTLSAPNTSSGPKSQVSGNFTVTPNGVYTGTITPSDGGAGGTFSPTSLTWTAENSAKTFTYAPSTVGPRTISATANPLLTAPSGVTYTSLDNVPPVVNAVSVNANGNTLTLTLTELDTAPILPATGITGFILSGSHTLSNGTRTASTTITFSISPVVRQGETLTLAYSGGNVTDSATPSNSLATISNMGVTNNSTLPPLATTFTFTGPTSGTVGSASSNFTVTPNSVYTGTVTPSAGAGGGSFSPASLTWTGDSSAKTFTYTPASAGTKTISATANPSLSAPASITFTANAVDGNSPVVLPVNPLAPRYPSSMGGTYPRVTDNAASGLILRDKVIATIGWGGIYPTDDKGGTDFRGVDARGLPSNVNMMSGETTSYHTDAIGDLQFALTKLSEAITAFQTADDDLTTVAEKAEFSEGKLNRINWLREVGLNMTEELNKLLGKFDTLGLYKSSPGTNTNIVSDVPPFIANLPQSPYPTDWGRKWPHTSND